MPRTDLTIEDTQARPPRHRTVTETTVPAGSLRIGDAAWLTRVNPRPELGEMTWYTVVDVVAGDRQVTIVVADGAAVTCADDAPIRCIRRTVQP
ncbi:MAG: hypothetical protein R2695_03980 [Acidimicrobiales bacterium]